MGTEEEEEEEEVLSKKKKKSVVVILRDPNKFTTKKESTLKTLFIGSILGEHKRKA